MIVLLRLQWQLHIGMIPGIAEAMRAGFGGSDAEGNVEQSCFRDPKSYVDRESSGQSESGKRKSGSSSSGSGTWT